MTHSTYNSRVRIENNSLNSTPLSARKQIAIFGSTNAGKSSLFNLLLNQDMSIIADYHGTTTDPVIKAMELIGYGPVALIDTAGLNDISVLGPERVKRSRQFIRRCDAAIYLIDATAYFSDSKAGELEVYSKIRAEFERLDIPHLLVFSKKDQLANIHIDHLKLEFPHALLLNLAAGQAGELYNRLISLLRLTDDSRAQPVITRLTVPGQTVLMVVPVDSEAPEGRLILPQVQLIRECLDHGVRCLVCRDSELVSTISDYTGSGIDLVVTDSQAFSFVSSVVPDSIPLTSFSMLLAAGKGDFELMINGLDQIRLLKAGDRILISEACSHNTSHEDIGRIKIPALLNRLTGIELDFNFCAGQSYPDDLSDYRLVVHCGGCMITGKTMRNRIKQAGDKHVAITNYGLLLAFGSGILERSTAIFKSRGLL